MRESGKETPESEQDSAGRDRIEPGSQEPGSVAAFCEQIRKDAKEETERIVGRARLSASRKREEAEKEADSIARQIRDAAQARARGIEARGLADASLEMRRTALRAEGEIVEEVLDRVRERLKEIRKSEQYLDFLKELTVQAIIALEDQECLVGPGIEDRPLYSPERVEEIEELVEHRKGKKVKLTLSEDLSPEGFGVRVYSGSKTILFDNTLDARMERLSDELKSIVAGEVFASG